MERVGVLNEGWINSPDALDPNLFLSVKTLQAEVDTLAHERHALIAERDAVEHEKDIQHARNASLIQSNLSVSVSLFSSYQPPQHILQLQEDIEKAVRILRSLTRDIHSSII